MTPQALLPATPHDREVLRALARRLSVEIARPAQADRIRRWKRHNALLPGRPMILIFPEGSWRELLAADGAPPLEDSSWNPLYYRLRQQVYEAMHYGPWTDNVLDPAIEVPKVVHNSGWGLQAHWTYSDRPGGARRFDPIIHQPSDLRKLRVPELVYDEASSRAAVERTHDLLGDILPVRLVGIKHVSFHLMSMYTAWRGLEEVMTDMILEPQWLHEAMEFLTEGHLSIVRQCEEQGLYDLNGDNTYHSTGGNSWSDEAALPGFEPSRVRACDLWASAESQELDAVSPPMHEEFAMRYEARLLRLFRHNGYGCCEGLHLKLPQVSRLPNLRRVSFSPFCHLQTALPAAAGRPYICSWKPHPACLVGQFQPERIRRTLREAIALARHHDAALEIILKDTHTCEGHPERFTEWARICREEVEAA